MLFCNKEYHLYQPCCSSESTKPDLNKINLVIHFPEPITVTNILSFLGLIGYYRNYVRGYSQIVIPLFEPTKKDANFVWSTKCQQAF
jgi:hypothetical protein